MNQTVPSNAVCARVLNELDRANELSPELIDHTRSCAACGQEVALRTNLRHRLKSAARNVETPPFLEARIRAHLEHTQPRKHWQIRWAAIAAAGALCVAGTVAYERGHLAWMASTQESYIASVSSQVATLMRVGLGDHIHCAVFRKYPQNIPPAQTLDHDLSSQYTGLVPALAKRLPPGFQVVMAHQCRYNGRRFVHLTAKSDSGLVSLVLARKAAGESFQAQGLLPALVESGIPFYRAGVLRFQITAFETADHLAYLVSDLPGEQNTGILTAMAPDVSVILSRDDGTKERSNL